jgi:SAM-dependent methyltransferase
MVYNQAMSEDRNVLAEWRGSAPYWEKHAATVRQLLAPISASLIRIAHITAGQRVLDVAGGTGEPSLEIAGIVAPQGRVVCTDAAAEMVAAAERLAHQRAIDNVEFKRCAADSLPFADGAFDVVVSRLGAMFFDDVLASLGEMLRVVKPVGTIALVVWGDPALNPFFGIITEVMARYVPSPPEDADAPGAFRFAERGKLAGLLEQAGAVNVQEHVVDFRIEAALTPAEFWQLRSEISDSLRAKVARLTADELARVVQEVEQQAKAFFSEGRMSLPAQVLIISANKPQ